MIKKLSQSKSFVKGAKNASFLAIGNILSEIITFVTFLFVARYFIPEDYGIYTTVLSFVGIYEVFTIRGINKSIIRSASNHETEITSILHKGASFRTFFIIIAIIGCNLSVLFFPYSLNTKVLIWIFSLNFIIVVSSTKES